MLRRLAAIAIAAALSLAASIATAQAGPTLDHARVQDALTCGITPDMAGFSQRGSDGRWRGFDTDVCRAVAVALFGTEEKVRFVAADTIEHFLASDEIDLALRGLTWTYGREVGRGLRFGPITFIDGQGFLLPKRLGIARSRQLAGKRICVQTGAASGAVTRYFQSRGWALQAVLFDDADAAKRAFFAGRCAAYSTDAFELAAAQRGRSDAGAYRILGERLSYEPLAPLLRRGDDAFLDLVRWAIFALIDAETLGISSRTVDRLMTSADPDIRSFLHPQEAPGFAAGWSYAIVKRLGNYGEIYERNLGGPGGLARGPNMPAAKGGQLTAPPLR